MSLPQLIGLQCVACQKSISSIIDGAFCDACGNPAHRKCMSSPQQTPPDRCPRCSGDPASAIAQEVQHQRKTQEHVAVAQPVQPNRKTQDQIAASTDEPATFQGSRASSRKNVRLPESDMTGPFPVSKLCPKCGSAEFTRVAPQSSIAFVKDRVCTKCRTRYTPPTPLWAGIVFILLGVFFLGGSVGSFLMADDGRVVPRVIGMVLGVAALGLGIRSFMNPGKV